MIVRNIRVRATGQWAHALFTFEKADPQNVKAESHIASVAAALGVAPDTLAAVEGTVDARTGVLLNLPLPQPPAPTAEQGAFALSSTAEKFLMLARRVGLA